MTLEVILGLPGTGKTTELIERVKTLISTNYSPDDFAICTYRKEMAKEMKGRLISAAHTDFNRVRYIATIHGLCKRLLGIEKQQIVNEAEIIDFAETNKYEYTPETGHDDEEGTITIDERYSYLNLILSLREWLITNMIPITQWKRCPHLPITHQITTTSFLQVTEAWEKWKADRSLYDFQDLLSVVHERHLAPEVPILIVDEFQDTSPLEYAIYCQWKEGKERVIIAGDPFQSIYSFKGATPAFFEAEQAIADKVTILRRSYRLPPTNWAFSKSILERVGYSPPDIDPTEHQGHVVTLTSIKYAPIVLGLKEASVMHLVRARYMKGILAGYLDTQGILHDLYPKRQLWLRDALQKVRKAEALTTADFITLVQAYPASSLLGAEKKKVLGDLKNPPLGQHWKPTLQWLFTPETLAKMRGPRPFDATLRGYIPEAARDRLTKALDYVGGTHRIRTIHAAKGDEAETVFLYDASTKKIDRAAQTKEGRQEEARVAFVGATRASRNLYIIKDFFYTSYRLELPPTHVGGHA